MTTIDPKPNTRPAAAASQPDTIYSTPLAQVPGFAFDQAVARVFPDMIKRSVPGYAETVAMSGIIAGRYAQPGSNLYDLGCSLGAVTLAMRHGVRAEGCHIIGIDNSASMIERAEHYVALDEGRVPVQMLCADILDYPLERCFADRMQGEWKSRLQGMIPSYGQNLKTNADLLLGIRERTLSTLGLKK